LNIEHFVEGISLRNAQCSVFNFQYSIFNEERPYGVSSVEKGETLRGQPLVNPDLSSKELEMAIVLILASGLLIVTNVYGHYCNSG